LGPYQIVSQIGAGGMGEVYQATDTRLRRTVAIKVLPELFAGDTERLARFQREAQTISSLNHPHICALHDIGDENGTHFLVMEYIEGETLDARIAKGPLRVDNALEYARQIAGALKASHEQGIIHRDLKPGNIMITTSGVKLLDFGLAKFGAEATPGSTLSQMPTQRLQPLTEEGTILGTLRYMAPEQLEGRHVDARTDVYALCLVLYEMITGHGVFEGKTRASLIASILKERPRPLSDFQPTAPPQLDRLVQTGLEKDPEKRWQSARELKHALEWVTLESRSTVVPASASVSWMWKGLVAALAVALIAALLVRFPSRNEPETRLDIWTGETADPAGFAVSPEGRRLVYVGSGSAGTQLWLRSLDADHAESLAQTQGASQPFWSPDGRSIGFFSEGKLRRIDLDSRVISAVATAVSPYGGTWGANGILYNPDPRGTVLHVPAEGGAPSPVVDQPSAGNLYPVFLRGGPAFLFRPSLGREIHLGWADTKKTKPLVHDAIAAALHPSGYLFFVRQQALLAQRFDMDAGELTGKEVAVADGVLTSNFGAGTGLSVSDSGVVAYRLGQATRQLAWFDRSGRRMGQAGGDSSNLRWPAISDNGRIAFQNTSLGDGQVWLIDTAKSAPTQLTFTSGAKLTPIWSPDGLWVAFVSMAGVRRMRSNGSGDEESLLAASPGSLGSLSDWSPDSKSILMSTDDIMVLSLEGKRELSPYLANPAYTEARGVFSPNGRWVAYESNESGRFEVYVRPFPNVSGSQKKVSSDGGSFARWSSDGRELFYLSPSGALMAAPVNTNGDVFTFEPAQKLFLTRIAAQEMSDLAHPYDVSKDGRFLMRVPGENEATPITVLRNWSPKEK